MAYIRFKTFPRVKHLDAVQSYVIDVYDTSNFINKSRWLINQALGSKLSLASKVDRHRCTVTVYEVKRKKWKAYKANKNFLSHHTHTQNGTEMR